MSAFFVEISKKITILVLNYIVAHQCLAMTSEAGHAVGMSMLVMQ